MKQIEIDITLRGVSPAQAEILLMAVNAVNNGETINSPEKLLRNSEYGNSNAGASAANILPQTEGATTNTNPQPNFNAPEQSTPAATPVVHTNGPNAGTSAPSVNTAETDASGLPWDERIHASTKTKNADGKWKKRKGVQQPTVEQVEAELRARTASAQPMPNFNAAEQPGNTGGGQPMPNFNQAPADDLSQIPEGMRGNPPQQPAANGFPNQGQAQPNFNAQANPGEVTFASMMQRINDATAAQKIDGMYLVGLCSRISHNHGCTINAVTDLMNRPVLIQAAMDLMTQDNKGI